MSPSLEEAVGLIHRKKPQKCVDSASKNVDLRERRTISTHLPIILTPFYQIVWVKEEMHPLLPMVSSLTGLIQGESSSKAIPLVDIPP